jgi:hypothetical protein
MKMWSTNKFLVSVVGTLAVASALPSTPVVPYFRQINDYCCGCASAAMVLGALFPGSPVVDQTDLSSVMRTTNETGTLVADVAHALALGPAGVTCPNPGTGAPPAEAVPDRFLGAASSDPCSATSANGNARGPVARTAPTRGHPARAHGTRAIVHRPGHCWLDGLAGLVDAGLIPVLLQHYSDADPGGHFRVLTGVSHHPLTGASHQPDSRQWELHDPWDRDAQPRTVSYSDDEMCRLWNKTEDQGVGGVVFPSHAAVVAVPWTVVVASTAANPESQLLADDETTSHFLVTATVRVPCPAPLDCSAVDADLLANPLGKALLALPDGFTLAADETDATKVFRMRRATNSTEWQGSASWRVSPSFPSVEPTSGKCV